MLRLGARPGDARHIAGACGTSVAGWAALAAGSPEVDPDAVTSFRRPSSLLLGCCGASVGATAMLDVSDGLLRDAGRLAWASGVVIDLDEPSRGGPAFVRDVARGWPTAERLGVDPLSAGARRRRGPRAARDVSARRCHPRRSADRRRAGDGDWGATVLVDGMCWASRPVGTTRRLTRRAVGASSPGTMRARSGLGSVAA